MKICIVGGGTAGWLCATILSSLRPDNEYVVIESESIGIIGVGEGSTGQFRTFIASPTFGINEQEFIKETDALPKLSIRFTNWTGDGSWFDASLEGSYTGYEIVDRALFSALASGTPLEHTALSSLLSINGKSPFVDKENPQPVHGFAYHFDSHKVGKYLKKLCANKGVSCIDTIITNVIAKNGKIISLHDANGKTYEADLFFDCTGFSRLLAKALDQKVISYADMLPVNKTLLFTVDNDDAPKLPVTNAIAMNAGWIFEIPTRNRIGRGYVYCDQYSTHEQAMEELNNKYGKVECVKTLSFEASKLENSFFGNVCALGLASVFFEPLQATSIHCTLFQIHNFIANVLTDNIDTTLNKASMDRYNQYTNALFDTTADFIAIHYEGGREDTPFWSWVTNHRSRSKFVKEIKELAKTRLTRFSDFAQINGAASQPLWNLSMAGIGLFDVDTIKECAKYLRIDLDATNNITKEFTATHSFLLEKALTVNDLNEVYRG